MARIELKKVQKKWGTFMGVKDIDLDIANEELIVLLGPSGCGKTTTMRMIAGLEEPTSGDILMNGEQMNDIDPRDRDVAMVFQGYALYPNMNVYENIRFPLRMRGVPKPEHDELIRRAASMVEMDPYLDRKPRALSGGQRQRAALARAIVRSPQVFLMDEPLSNLDAKLRQSMRIQIKQLQRALKITTIYVTHDQIEAMTLADRIVVMNEGSCQQIGTPDEIYSYPANTFVASFIGSPPMNLISGSMNNRVFSSADVTVAGIRETDTGDLILGVRPEDTYISDDADDAHVVGEVYGIEPTGDMTYLTVKAGEHMLEVKADRSFRADLGDTAHLKFDLERLNYFDASNGRRIS